MISTAFEDLWELEEDLPCGDEVAAVADTRNQQRNRSNHQRPENS